MTTLNPKDFQVTQAGINNILALIKKIDDKITNLSVVVDALESRIIFNEYPGFDGGDATTLYFVIDYDGGDASTAIFTATFDGGYA